MILAVLQSSVLLLIAFAVVYFLRRQSAAVRHLLLTVALVAATIVPLIGRFLPEHARSRELYSRVQNETEILLKLDTVVEPTATPPFQSAPRPQLPLGFVAWILGASLNAAVFFAGLLRIARVARRARPFDCTSLRMSQRIRVLQSESAILGTCGTFRPRVFLPRDADKWSADRLRIVLTHELAHIHRGDWLIQILAEAARTVYWFNPLFWFLCRRLRAESEHACDDVVLNVGINGNDYAAHLLELARTLRTSTPALYPVLAMAKPRHIERRFVAMLNPTLNRKPVSRAAVLIACGLALVVTVPLSAVRAGEESKPGVATPQIVAAPEIVSVAKTGTPSSAKTAVRRAAAKPAPRQGLADGSLAGSVTDGSGAFVPGVALTVSSATQTQNTVREREVQTTVSDETGHYTFAALTPGQYWLRAEVPGFMTFRTVVRVERGQTSTQSVTLSVGTIRQHVIVTAVGQPKPTFPAGVPQRIRVGGNVQAANLTSQVRPVYPQNARDAGIDGTVHLQALIATDGALVGLTPLNDVDADLTASALDAVKQWRYKPTLLNGVPVEVLTTIDIEFKLSQ